MSDNNQLQISISLNGYANDDIARVVGGKISEVINSISNSVNLSDLDGVSVSYDYFAALNSVDRGFVSSKEIHPSTGEVIGVAMVVRVKRNGEPKSHIVFSAPFLEGIIDEAGTESWLSAVSIIYHECAHVSNSSALNKCFPNYLMEHKYENIQEQMRTECWISVMEEYCATRMSALKEHNQNQMFKDTFLNQAIKLESKCREKVLDYFDHQNVDRGLDEVYSEVYRVLTLASYYLGDSAARDIDIQCLFESNTDILWLKNYILRLNDICLEMYEAYGEWSSFDIFEGIADILIEILLFVGVEMKNTSEGLWVDFHG